MSKVSLVFFLVAGIIGAISWASRNENGPLNHSGTVAWAIVALWALLELIGVVA